MDRKPAVSCVFVCHDGAGRILLARRSAGARDEPGRWDCGAGALEFGETFEAAVGREVTEEYSAAPLAVDLLGVRNVLRADPPSHWVAVVFAVLLDPAAVRIGEPHKFDALRWFGPGLVSEGDRGAAWAQPPSGRTPESSGYNTGIRTIPAHTQTTPGPSYHLDPLRKLTLGDLPAPLHSQLPATLELVAAGLSPAR